MKKRFVGIFILSILILSLFAGVVVAQTSSKTPSGVLKSLWDVFFGGIFGDGNFNIGNYKVDISRVLLMFLIVLLVYSISDFIPFFPEGKDGVKWAFAITVAILSFLFVDGGDIELILTNYEALGVALTSIIPLVILLAFSFKLQERRPLMARFLNVPIFLIFSFYLVSKWWSLKDTESILKTVYLVTLSVSLAWLFFNKRIVRFIFREELKTQMNVDLKDVMQSLQGEIERRERNIPRGLGSSALNAYNLKTQRLRKQLEEMSKRLSS